MPWKPWPMAGLLATIVACTQTAPVASPESGIRGMVESSAGQCTDPRPQACTREYAPVCAIRDTGLRCMTTPCPSSEYRSYPNACEACADPRVRSWKAGACPDDQNKKAR